jgi:hypothetical protein
VDLSGRIDNVHGGCPTPTFTLRGQTVRTNSATELVGGSCRDLRDGKDVTVHGQQQDNRNVLALRIEFNR